MRSEIRKLRHPNEGLYGGMLTTIGSFVWIVVLGGIFLAAMAKPQMLPHLLILLVYVGIGALFAWIGAALYRAYAMGNMVLLSERQFPELYAIHCEMARALGLAEVPTAFIHNSSGVMNAFAIRLLRGRYVFLTSALVVVEENAQLRFVIGHEIAHHVLGHLNVFKHWLRIPAYFVPFLYRAYSRAREYSCDAVAASVLPDIRDGFGALQMLACGAKRLNGAMRSDAFAAQEQMVPGMAGFFVEIFSTHPRMTRRVARLVALYASPANRDEVF